MNPAIVGAVGASLFYSYKTGRLSNFIDNLRNKNNDSSTTTSSSASSSQATHQESRRNQPVVIVPQSSNARNSYLVPFGVACLVGLGGYFYFIHSSGTKKVIGRVEETAEETQNLVQQTDDNNAKRFEILDKKNESRAQNLEIEIRGEQRAGFKVISEQIYCLQQVAIQTLNAVASSLNANNNQTSNNESDNITNEKLLGFCDKAQEMADTIISDQHILKIKENNLNDIKAEIQIRSNNNKDNEYDIIFNNNDITPGGPLDDDQHNNNNNNNNNNSNPFDINNNNNNKHQSTIITDVSSSSYKDNITQHHNSSDDIDHDNMISNMIQKLQDGVKPIEIGYHIWNNKQYIAVGTAMMFTFYGVHKVMNRNDSLNHPHYQIIQQ